MDSHHRMAGICIAKTPSLITFPLASAITVFNHIPWVSCQVSRPINLAFQNLLIDPKWILIRVSTWRKWIPSLIALHLPQYNYHVHAYLKSAVRCLGKSILPSKSSHRSQMNSHHRIAGICMVKIPFTHHLPLPQNNHCVHSYLESAVRCLGKSIILPSKIFSLIPNEFSS